MQDYLEAGIRILMDARKDEQRDRLVDRQSKRLQDCIHSYFSKELNGVRTQSFHSLLSEDPLEMLGSRPG